MPKSREKPDQKARRIAAEFSGDGIEVEGANFICRNCGKLVGEISKMRKSQIDQHIKSAKHVLNAELKSKHTSPLSTEKQKPYTTDLCRVCFIFLLTI